MRKKDVLKVDRFSDRMLSLLDKAGLEAEDRSSEEDTPVFEVHAGWDTVARFSPTTQFDPDGFMGKSVLHNLYNSFTMEVLPPEDLISTNRLFLVKEEMLPFTPRSAPLVKKLLDAAVEFNRLKKEMAPAVEEMIRGKYDWIKCGSLIYNMDSAPLFRWEDAICQVEGLARRRWCGSVMVVVEGDILLRPGIMLDGDGNLRGVSILSMTVMGGDAEMAARMLLLGKKLESL